jgi:hypothetical protein
MMRRPFGFCGVVTAIVIASLTIEARPARAQESTGGSFFSAVVKSTAIDPTTYAPAAVTYGVTRLDWNSSQVFFRNGYIEQNQKFTVSGLPDDQPIGFATGNKRIVWKAVGVFEASALNNLAMHSVARSLKERYPEHGRLIATLSWAERISFASYITYMQSSASYQQWRQNTARAQALGLH